MTIYDKAKIKCRTFIESINILFNMGKDLETEVGNKQATLVSGTNIKSINGSSILGEGNMVIEGDNPGIVAGDAGKALVVNAGETGAEWSNGIKVADTPANEHNAVNQTWVENVAYEDDTVNNITHKEGTEIITGTKKLVAQDDALFKARFFAISPAYETDNVPSVQAQSRTIVWTDENLTKELCVMGYIQRINLQDEFMLAMTNRYGISGDVRFQIISKYKDNGDSTYSKVSYALCPDRNSSTVSDYANNEVVTINVLKKLGLIS